MVSFYFTIFRWSLHLCLFHFYFNPYESCAGIPTFHDSIDFYVRIGAARKEARLRYLQNYWVDKVRGLPHIVLNTPSDNARSCGIANVGVKGVKPGELAKRLLDKYKIYTVAIDNGNVQGCRITPNVYTLQGELDRLVDALKQIKS